MGGTQGEREREKREREKRERERPRRRARWRQPRGRTSTPPLAVMAEGRNRRGTAAARWRAKRRRSCTTSPPNRLPTSIPTTTRFFTTRLSTSVYSAVPVCPSAHAHAAGKGGCTEESARTSLRSDMSPSPLLEKGRESRLADAGGKGRSADQRNTNERCGHRPGMACQLRGGATRAWCQQQAAHRPHKGRRSR